MGEPGSDRRQQSVITTDHPPPDGPQQRGPALTRRQALAILGGLMVAGGAGAIVAVDRSSTDTTTATPGTPAPTAAAPGTPAPTAAAPASPNSRTLQADPTTTIAAPPAQVNDVRPPLPKRAVSMWMNTFSPPTVAELPADVLDTVNLVIYAMAQSAAGGTGTLHWEPRNQGYSQAAADIAGLTARGTPVLLGIGGSNDGGITLVNDEQVEQFCESIRFFVETFGFSGVDLDLEPSGSTWSTDAVVAVVRTLKSEFGKDFLVGLTVGLYGDHTGDWLSLAAMLRDDYDYWAPMLYDFPEAHDERLVPVALEKIATAVAGGVPTSKQILGFMCNAYYNTSPVPVTTAVWQAALALYPDLRGAFIWESKLELAANYEWTRTVGTSLKAGF